ncbi:MAG TPA: hypothetical protein VGG62_02830, partial [Terracidiphilus sp.]
MGFLLGTIFGGWTRRAQQHGLNLPVCRLVRASMPHMHCERQNPAVSKSLSMGWGKKTLAYDDLRDWIKTLEKQGEL